MPDSVFKIWVEIEEQQNGTEGESISHSGLLEGSSVETFDDLDEAVAFGNALQTVARQLGDLHDTHTMMGRALAGDSNDAEHDALYEAHAVLGAMLDSPHTSAAPVEPPSM